MDRTNNEDALARLAADLDTLAMQAESLATEAAHLLEARRECDDATAPSVDTARALGLAAGRAHHAITTTAVLTAGAVGHARVHLDDAERTTRVWLARHLGISRRHAAVWCRSAEALGRFPSAEAALLDGEISPGHLDALASVIPARLRGTELDAAIDLVTELVPTLLETARATTVDEFEIFCHHVRARLDHDGPADRSGEPSRVWLSKLFDGRWALSGDLCADDGAIARTILDDVMARRRAAEASSADASDPEQGRRMPSERMAEALRALLIDGAGAKRPGCVGLFLHIDLEDLASVPDTAHTEANLDITDDTLWQLLACSDVTPIFNTDGMPLCYGRTRRLPPPMLRRALAHRDRRCRFGWCDAAPVWTQSHHIPFWSNGGPTNPATCALGCPFHHHQIHDRGWSMSGTPPDVTITRPDGTPHTDDQRWHGPSRERQRADRRAIVERLERERRRLQVSI